MLRIDITGDAATVRHLTAVEQAIDTTPPLDAVADAAIPIVRTYPPELPNQRYVRTGQLGRGWAAHAAGTVIHLDNPVEYAGRVYGPNQGRAFVGRWKTPAELRAAILPGVLAAYRAWVKRIVGHR